MNILAVYVAHRDVMVFEGKFSSSQLRNDPWYAITQPIGPHMCYRNEKNARSELRWYQETSETVKGVSNIL